MKLKRAIAVSLVATLALAACGREADQAPRASAPGSTGDAAVSKEADLQSTAGNYNEALERLHKASQALRESIQALGQRPSGPQRTVAIAMAHQALSVTNQAAAQLPPEMRPDAVGAPSPAVGSAASGIAGTQPDNPESVQALQSAAEALRASVQAMVDQPPGERRTQATRDAHRALADVNRAMIALPPKGQGAK